MSLFNGKRINTDIFKIDFERMRRGWYNDKYFSNIVAILEALAVGDYLYGGSNPYGIVDADKVKVGDIEVEMQIFHRRKPYSIVTGTDKAIAMLRGATGFWDKNDTWRDTSSNLEVLSVEDGYLAPYGGDPIRVTPVMKIRGRYRDFAILETPVIGCLTRGSRLATNVYETLKAANGKPVLQFAARFDVHEAQPIDGYSYQIAVSRYNHDFGTTVTPFVSTDSQGDWWNGTGGGTVAHAYIACFLGDLSEAMVQYAAVAPLEYKRVALIDFRNDCVHDTMATIKALWRKHLEYLKKGDFEMAERFRLFGVRPDTSGSQRDVSIEPLGDPRLDCGVNPRLVWKLRKALDGAVQYLDPPFEYKKEAEQFVSGVKIIVSGGFRPDKIRMFEKLGVPVDVYGVGSYLLENCSTCGTNNDFTADITRVKVAGKWVEIAKVGRRTCENSDLAVVQL